MDIVFLNLLWLLWVLSNIFRLANTLTSFQRYINKILIKKLNIFVIVSLDVIFIYIDDKKDSHIIAI